MVISIFDRQASPMYSSYPFYSSEAGVGLCKLAYYEFLDLLHGLLFSKWNMGSPSFFRWDFSFKRRNHVRLP